MNRVLRPFPSWARVAALGLVILAVALLTYWSAIWMRYGRADDYMYVRMSRLDDLREFFFPFNLDMGRPIPGWLTGGVLPEADEVAGLGRLRALTTGLVALSGFVVALLSLQLTRSGATWVRYAAALGVGLTPLVLTSSPSTATWAILIGALHAFSTALLAGMLVAWAHRLWWIPSAALLLVTAFTYQQVVPLAMLPAFMLTAVAFARHEVVRWWRPVVVAAMGVLSLALNAAFVMSRDGAGASRVGQGTWDERIDWYVHAFLPVVFDLHVPSTAGGALWSGLLALALACTPLVLGVRHAALPAAALLATVGCALAVLPLEMWASYRVASPTQLCLWAGVALCVAYTLVHLTWRPASWVALLGCFVLLGFALQTAHARAVEYIAEPNARDWKSIRCVVGAGNTFDPLQKWYPTPWNASTSPVIIGDEYGVIGSSVTWSLQAELWIAEDLVDGPGRPDWEVLPDVAAPVEPEPDREPFPVDGCAR